MLDICKNALLAGVAVGALLSSAPAMALQITATDSIPVGQSVNLGNIDPQAPVGTIAGQNVFALIGGGFIYGWCIDVFHNITLGPQYTFDIGTLTGGFTTDNSPAMHLLSDQTVDRLAGLMEVGNGILEGPVGNLDAANAHFNLTGGNAGSPDDWSAALQLAIWDIEYHVNDPVDFAELDWSGGSTTLRTRAIYEHLVTDTSIVGNANDLLSVDSHQSFGYATAQLNLTSIPVPEPGSLALLGFGIFGMIGIAGWKRFRYNDDAIA